MISRFLTRMAGPLPGLLSSRPPLARAPVGGVFAPQTSRDVLRPRDPS